MAGELVKALIAAKKAFGPLHKNKENPHFKSKYADLAALHEAVDAALSANGFAVTQPLGFDEKDRYGIWTKLMHTGGEELKSFYLLSQALEPQKLAAAITYGRRNSLSSLLGIPADDDDDGNATQEAPPAKKEYKLKPVAPAAPAPVKEPVVIVPKATEPKSQDGMESALVQIMQVSNKVQEGARNDGQKWKRYSLKIKFTESGLESWASTFSETAYNMAEKYRLSGLSILMNYKEQTKGETVYINVEDFTEVANAEA